MNAINFQYGVKGFFKIEKYQADENGEPILSTKELVRDWFPNLVLDSGLDYLGVSGQTVNGACRVGAGSTPPANGQTALVSQIAATTTVIGSTLSYQNSTLPFYSQAGSTFRFAAGAATGNIAEIGISPATTGNLFSRALVLDSLGNPTTITVLAGEILDITYQLRIYVPTSDVSGTLTLGTEGGSYNFTSRAIGFVSPSNWNPQSNQGPSVNSTPIYTKESQSLDAVTTLRQGSGSSGGTVPITSTYVNGNYYKDFTINLDVSNANYATGMGWLSVGLSSCAYQVSFSPKIPKINTKKFTMVMRVSWARV